MRFSLSTAQGRITALERERNALNMRLSSSKLAVEDRKKEIAQLNSTITSQKQQVRFCTILVLCSPWKSEAVAYAWNLVSVLQKYAILNGYFRTENPFSLVAGAFFDTGTQTFKPE